MMAEWIESKLFRIKGRQQLILWVFDGGMRDRIHAMFFRPTDSDRVDALMDTYVRLGSLPKKLRDAVEAAMKKRIEESDENLAFSRDVK